MPLSAEEVIRPECLNPPSNPLDARIRYPYFLEED